MLLYVSLLERKSFIRRSEGLNLNPVGRSLSSIFRHLAHAWLESREDCVKMRASRALVLIALFSLCTLIGAARISVRQGNESGGSLLEQANATSQPSIPASIPVSARDSATKQANLAASLHFELLLLFLFGSVLLSLGTTINLMLSRKLKRKSMHARLEVSNQLTKSTARR